MVHFEGDKSFPQPASHVWSKLADARFLADCVPGVEAITHAEPARVSCTLRPGFAFVRGTLELSIEIVEVVFLVNVRNQVTYVLEQRGMLIFWIPDPGY